MTSEKFILMVDEIVADYANEHTDVTDNATLLVPSDIYVVWYCKTLQNHKALASTPRHDGMYYEITYNGDKDEIYLDAYKKFENRCLAVTE